MSWGNGVLPRVAQQFGQESWTEMNNGDCSAILFQSLGNSASQKIFVVSSNESQFWMF